MDDIPGLTVTRHDSTKPDETIPADEPFTSTGVTGSKLVVNLSEPSRINQLEFTTESGSSVIVKVVVKFGSGPDAENLTLFDGHSVEVDSGDRLDIPIEPDVTNVRKITITFYNEDSQTVDVFGCIEKGWWLKSFNRSFDFEWTFHLG